MNLALFDLDGTITRHDTWSEFLRFSASKTRRLVAGILLSPLIVAYKLGLLPGRVGRPIAARVAFAGRNAMEVREMGRQYVSGSLAPILRRRALERIEWHKTQGDTVVVVSAALDVYLRGWCDSLGVDVICTRLEERNGRLTGRYLDGDCCGGEKAARIRRCYDLRRYAIIYAYGDTDEDREMLELAHEKYFRWKKIDDCSSLPSAHPAIRTRRR